MPITLELTRRQVLCASATAAGLIAAHECLAGPRTAMTAPRILRLDLQSAAPLAEMKRFYHELIGLQVTEDNPGRLTIAAGETKITFTPAQSGKPFYHFAFNIPENKILSAYNWQKERSPLLGQRRRVHCAARSEERRTRSVQHERHPLRERDRLRR
jgi:hypothetical protein